jgi:hypothetical protein
MSEEGLQGFAEELRLEVEEAVRDPERSSEVEFTRTVLDRLAEDGVLENPTILEQDQEGIRCYLRLPETSCRWTDSTLLIRLNGRSGLKRRSVASA